MSRSFAEACFKQIKGFGSYGFPESHAASFALLVYVSAWIKKHHPAAFAAALLNSQPMGFYAPAEIVRDAREHEVTVLAPDAAYQRLGLRPWSATATGELCLRLGLRQIDGFGEGRRRRHHGQSRLWLSRLRRFRPPHRLAQTRADHPGRGRCLSRFRPGPPRRAVGGAPPARRQAAAAVRAAVSARPGRRRRSRRCPRCRSANMCSPIIRPSGFRSKAIPPSSCGRVSTAEGIVLLRGCGRSRATAPRSAAPASCWCASGPAKAPPSSSPCRDETGVCNVVIWDRTVPSNYRKEVMGARLLLAEGKVQKSPEGVVHLMAERLIDRRPGSAAVSSDDALPPAATTHRHPRNVRVLPPSRDFH